jgi:hypothetical protein
MRTKCQRRALPISELSQKLVISPKHHIRSKFVSVVMVYAVYACSVKSEILGALEEAIIPPINILMALFE